MLIAEGKPGCVCMGKNETVTDEKIMSLLYQCLMQQGIISADSDFESKEMKNNYELQL